MWPGVGSDHWLREDVRSSLLKKDGQRGGDSEEAIRSGDDSARGGGRSHLPKECGTTQRAASDDSEKVMAEWPDRWCTGPCPCEGPEGRWCRGPCPCEGPKGSVTGPEPSVIPRIGPRPKGPGAGRPVPGRAEQGR